MGNGTDLAEKISVTHFHEIMTMFGNVLRNMPDRDAKFILDNISESRELFVNTCKGYSTLLQSTLILSKISLLKLYYHDVYKIELNLSGVVFPDNLEFPVLMIDDLSMDEDQIMESLKNYFSEWEFPMNLYKYMDPVASHINREAEGEQIRKLQSGLVAFAHKGKDEPDKNLRNESYNSATTKGKQFMKYREYLLCTGFHRYIKGYFMDGKSWTRTSSLWNNSGLVHGRWDKEGGKLFAGCGTVQGVDPNCGPREIVQ